VRQRLADHFVRHGWVLVRNVLGQDLVARLRNHAEDLYSGRVVLPQSLPLPSYLSWDLSRADEKLRTNEYVVQLDDAFTSLLTGPVGPIAARLARTEHVRLWVSSLITKMPAAGRDATLTHVGWHADIAYWPTCSSARMLTAWIPLTACGADDGALQFVDGSHRWDGSYADQLRSLRSFRKPQAIDTDDLANHGLAVRIETPRYRPGDLSFHHCRLLHGSGANVGSSARIALSLHLQDKDNAYTHAATSHFNDGLARKRADGCPDYADPKWFPVLRRDDER
jgi:ectoine hydroxylase-related dioxygenase (phytanoyl-CoA dioxygenase family)